MNAESSSTSQAAPDLSNGATGWELALVSASSSYESSATDKLVKIMLRSPCFPSSYSVNVVC